MKKYGFEISINGEKICRAGLDTDYYVVTCSLLSTLRKKDEATEVSLEVGGLNAVNRNHVNWESKVLNPGDKISIEIIDENFDAPSKVTVPDAEEFILEQKIKYFQRLKEELKDHLKDN